MSAAGRKMSLAQATMLVAGNMIGTGVFLLPVNLAQVGGIAIFGWVIATAGVAALGLVFAKLGELNPQQGGPYAYARDFLGPYAGFQTNYVYWFGNWIGNIAIAVAAVGYLAELIPGDQRLRRRASSPPPPSSGCSRSPTSSGRAWSARWRPGRWRSASSRSSAIALFGWFWFDSATFLAGWNVSGESNMHAVSRAASMALWAYMGIESAAVSAGVIENPKRNVPLATLIGLGLAAVVYMLSSTVIMGILPNEELRTSHAPFAEAARLALGTAGAIVISVCAVLKSVGSLGGWMLLVGQSAQGGGRRRHVSARLRAPQRATACRAAGSSSSAVLMTVVLFATMSPTLAGQFNNMVDLAVILIIVPYVYSAVAVVKVIHDHELPAHDVPHLQVDRARRGRVLPVGSHRRRSGHGRARDGGAADQRAAVSVLHPLDGGSREAQSGAHEQSRTESSQRPRIEHVHRPDKESCHATDSMLVDPSGGRRRTLLAAAVLALLARLRSARRRRRPPAPPGLPAGLDWTFNFDATLRARSASPIRSTRTRSPSNRPAISATTGSKASIKPALERGRTRRTAPRSSTARSAASASAPTARRRRWSATTPPRSTSRISTSAGAPATARRLGENVLDFTVGRTQYKLGHGMLLWDGAAEGGSRGGYWTNARKAFEFAAIGRFKPGNHTFEAFYLDKDDLPEADSDSKLWGVNYEYAIGEDTTLGATYMKWSGESRRGAAARRARRLQPARLHGAVPEPEGALVRGRSTRMEDNGDCARLHGVERAGGLSVRDRRGSRSSPIATPFFEGDDPATADERSLRRAVHRLLRLGHLVAGRDRRRVLRLELEPDLAPAARARDAERRASRTGLIFYDFQLDNPASAGVTSDDVALRARLVHGLDASTTTSS